MVSLIQLVKNASVSIEGSIVAAIELGVLALVGFEKIDTEKTADELINRIIHYRIFKDTNGKSNLNLKDVNGGLLLIPQFTLVADTRTGTRPGFSLGMLPQEGKKLFEYLIATAKNQYHTIACGQFGAYMQINLCNDGPVTYLLKSSY